MKKLALIFLLGLNFLAAFSISLDQPSLHVATERGQTSRHKIKLTNNNPESVTLRVYAQDWQYTPDGAKEFLPADTLEDSCAKWIDLSARSITIPANSSKEYRFEIKTPANARGGQQAVIFFETNTDMTSGAVSYGVRLGSLIYQKTKKHTVESLEPILLQAKYQDGAYIYTLGFENKGNAWNSVQGSVSLVQDGKILEQQELGAKGLLPGQAAEYFGAFAAGPASERVEVLYVLEDSGGALQTGQLLTAESAEMIAQTKVWVDKFEPAFSNGALTISCALASGTPVRVNPLVKIFRQGTGELMKTVEFNPKIIRPGKIETMSISWPIGAGILGSLPAGDYNCVLSIAHGNEILTDEKPVRIN